MSMMEYRKTVELQRRAEHPRPNGVTIQELGVDGCEYCNAFTGADHLISNGVTMQEWISVEDRLPPDFISVLGYMTDAGDFPPVRECYIVGNAFFFPALRDVHPVSHWMPLPEPPKGE